MRKSLQLSSIVALALVTFVGAFLVANHDIPPVYAHNAQVIRVIEHAVAQHTIADSNVLVFANPIFDAANKKQVGSDSGYCVLTIKGVLFECHSTFFFTQGQITVEGPFKLSGVDTLLAITGGTGAYQEAQGQMRLHVLSDTQDALTFYIQQ